jgi:hypothetical protein
MGFSSVDDMISEMTTGGKTWRQDFYKITSGTWAAGRWYDLSTFAGSPVANTYPGTALAAVAPDESTGWGLYHGGNVSTDTKHLMNVMAVANAATGVPAVMMLVDVCLYYPDIPFNSASQQTLNNTNTLTRYTDGIGLRSYMMVDAGTGGTAHNLDNTAGTGTQYVNTADATKQHPGTISFVASAIQGHIAHSGTAANNTGAFLPLAAGDVGLKRYSHWKLSASSTGGATAGNLVICKPLATLPITTLNVAAERDLVNQLASMPRIRDGACLNWLVFVGGNTAANTVFQGAVETAWG